VGEPGDARHREILGLVDGVRARLSDANRAREVALPACRQVIRLSGSSIRAVHRQDPSAAADLAAQAEAALREAQGAVAGFPAVAHAGFLHDAEKEYAEARLTAALVAGEPLPGPDDLALSPTSWLRGLAEAASELRRHLLDRLRDEQLDRGEELLAVMEDVYDALVTVDFPDAVTGGLRRTVDALRAVLERTRGDVTTTVLQARLRGSLDAQRLGQPDAPG
jgi:translin